MYQKFCGYGEINPVISQGPTSPLVGAYYPRIEMIHYLLFKCILKKKKNSGTGKEELGLTTVFIFMKEHIEIK